MMRWKIVAAALAVTLIGSYLAGAGPYPAPQPGRSGPKPLTQPAVPAAPLIPDTLRAKRFEVVNQSGRVLARLEGNEWGARVQFFSAAGKIVADGGSTPDGGSQFAVYDDADNPTDTASISSLRSEADVIAEDKHGRVQISTGTAPGEVGETPRGASILEHGRVVWQANSRR